MNIELTATEFRRLLDMVYIGNWILNSTRGADRFEIYDKVEGKLFSNCEKEGMHDLYAVSNGKYGPSTDFENGGIHEAIASYEDAIFYEILAEELAHRDMNFEPISLDNFDELTRRIENYISEFEQNGMNNITVDN